MQLAQSFKRKSCGHASPVRNIFSVAVARRGKSLRTRETENLERDVAALRNGDIGLNAASLTYLSP